MKKTRKKACLLLKRDVSDTGFCLRLLVGLGQLGPIDRASLYLRTPATKPIRLTFVHDVCDVGFVNPIGVAAGVQRQKLTPSVGPK
jgi:hypothetical protein